MHDEMLKRFGREVTVMVEVRHCDGTGLEARRVVWKDGRCGLCLCVGLTRSLKGSSHPHPLRPRRGHRRVVFSDSVQSPLTAGNRQAWRCQSLPRRWEKYSES